MQRTLDGVGSAERERGPHTALLHLCAAPLASQRPLQRPRALGPPSLPNYNLRATLNAAQSSLLVAVSLLAAGHWPWDSHGPLSLDLRAPQGRRVLECLQDIGVGLKQVSSWLARGSKKLWASVAPFPPRGWGGAGWDTSSFRALSLFPLSLLLTTSSLPWGGGSCDHTRGSYPESGLGGAPRRALLLARGLLCLHFWGPALSPSFHDITLQVLAIK